MPTSPPALWRVLCPVALLTALAGCATPHAPIVRRTPAPLPNSTPAQSPPPAVVDAQPPPAAPAPRVTGVPPVPASAAPAPPRPRFYGESAAFNFSDESIQAVAKAILGEMLQQRYTIAPGVEGTVTLVSPKPIGPEEALRLFERALASNELRLIYSHGSFQILRADQALGSGLTAPSARSGGSGRGFETKIIPLRWVSATEMEKLLKPYARPAALVDVDTTRNQITLAGSQEELANYLRIVDQFDVNWMGSMSVASIPIVSGRASAVVADLEKVFGGNSGLPTAGIARFIPLDGSGTLVVIAPHPHILDQVMSWVDRFEASGGEAARIYSYDLKYLSAKDLADRLEEVVGQATLAGFSNTDAPPSSERGNAATTPGAAAPTVRFEGVGVSAVEETNSVLVRATPVAWRALREAIARIDVMPLQVHIEAQIAEVRASGALSYGVSWFFDRAVTAPPGEGGLGLPDAADAAWRSIRGTIRPADQGVGWVLRGGNAAAVLQALDQVSDVRILQSPSVFVRNNTEAHLNVGSRIPVVSVRLEPTGGGNPVSQVQYLDTGLVLKVKPRATREGMVFLDIEQEVSSPGAAASADANGNVRIDTNTLKTQVTVQAGDTVMLAGLTQHAKDRSSSGAPGAARLPVIGGLLGRQSAGDRRDELVMLLTATIATDPTEVRKLTDEYLRRFRAIEPPPGQVGK